MRVLFLVLVFSFLTLTSAHADSFSFLAFGDNRDGDETFKLLLNKASKEKNIAFAFNTGDFVSRGSESEYKKYTKIIGKYPSLNIYHVPGNHDMVAGGWRRFNKYFGSHYYSFDYKNAHFVILNNAFRESFTEKQISWLKRDLAATKKPLKFVFFHKPVFDPSGFYNDHIMDSRRMAERMILIFKRYKVGYVICGHIHGYGHARRDKIDYFITGGAGAPLYLPSQLGGFYHYMRFDIDGNKVSARAVRIFD
ncbi:MAG: metallophosphoesterase [Candidatus Saganbacteria bacterium]|nr:metallophosphoesterase [Candidatus Saganbacteria bacterium]